MNEDQDLTIFEMKCQICWTKRRIICSKPQNSAISQYKSRPDGIDRLK